MFIIDQLKRGDRSLQFLAATMLAGIAVLFCGLWYVQVISAQRFRTDWKAQAFRTVRVPALRGRILDRNRIPLADNRPSYNLGVYLGELRRHYEFEYTNHVKRAYLAANPQAKLTATIKSELQRQSRYRVVSNLLFEVSTCLDEPSVLIEQAFDRHDKSQRSLALPLMKDLEPRQVALFAEQASRFPQVELQPQPVRVYPHKTLAAHLIGHLKRDDRPEQTEDLSFRFLLPDYVGARGVEWAFDGALRGHAGVKSVLINHLSYRQSEETLIGPAPGSNVVLTIDRALQQAAERSLGGSLSTQRGAVVAMDVHTGDILAVASSPTFDPNFFVTPPQNAEERARILERWNDEQLRPMFNRAAYGLYPAGSIFKIIVALAGLESGIINPYDIYLSEGYYQLGGRGRQISDTAGPGDFDFEKAFYRSSNPYFIHYGLQIGPEKLVEMARRFRLGEPTGLPTRQEAAGYLPSLRPLRKRNHDRWMPGDTANLSIGHGEILVTPLQMAVLTAAVANGGKVIQPRLVSAIEPAENAGPENTTTFAAGIVRGEISVSKESLNLLRKAMLADVENPAGTGHRGAFIPGFRICGKTGTAQLQVPKEAITWFVSFAPYENPRYAIAVVVEGGVSGGQSCAPIAREIYEAIVKRHAKSVSENSVMGGTGYQPVPSGDAPDGRERVSDTNPSASYVGIATVVPVGGSPTGAGESPAPPISQIGPKASTLVHTP